MKLMLKKWMEIFGRIRKSKKNNTISANIVNGNIIQDAVIENKIITINDPMLMIRSAGKESKELTKCFQNIRTEISLQHKLYPYYETGIEEINGENYLYSKPAIPEAREKYPGWVNGTFKIANEDIAKKYSFDEMARRAYISQRPVDLKMVKLVKMLGNEIDPFQDGFLAETKNVNFKLIPEKLPDAFPCILEVDGSNIQYDVMLKIQPVDPDKHIFCMASETILEGLEIGITYYMETKKTDITFKSNCSTWNEAKKFILFQMNAQKGAVIKIKTKEDNVVFRTTLQEPLGSESIEELKADIELIKDVILVEAEFGVSFSILENFSIEDRRLLKFLSNSVRGIAYEVHWDSFEVEAKITPADDTNVEELFKESFKFKYTEVVDVRVQQTWIKGIKINNELQWCKLETPDQVYADFLKVQQTNEKKIKLKLVPADEEKKATRIVILD